MFALGLEALPLLFGEQLGNFTIDLFLDGAHLRKGLAQYCVQFWSVAIEYRLNVFLLLQSQVQWSQHLPWSVGWWRATFCTRVELCPTIECGTGNRPSNKQRNHHGKCR